MTDQASHHDRYNPCPVCRPGQENTRLVTCPISCGGPSRCFDCLEQRYKAVESERDKAIESARDFELEWNKEKKRACDDEAINQNAYVGNAMRKLGGILR